MTENETLSEAETREQIIDKRLHEEGWKEEYIKREINSIKSDFNVKRYDLKKGEGKEEGRFIDYVLLAHDKSVLAIIEAKRFSLDAEKGSIQATTYQKDIESQIKIVVPIFLTNGNKWYLKEKGYPTREVSGPLSQRDLSRRMEISKDRKVLSDLGVSSKILNRSKNVEIVKQVLNHFEKGNRKALINMATGTGKTRVAMALIEALIRANYIRNVLFVVDRISLGRQAYSSFDNFLHGEPRTILNEEGDFDMDKRMYVSTVQTLMTKDERYGHKFQKFGPGFFDLIIFDEAHRSYYDKQNLVAQYFDAITKENNRGGTQKFIALGDIRKIPVPLPPLPLQEKFARIVEKVEKMKEKQKESKEKIDNLFGALMQKAFKGELLK